MSPSLIATKASGLMSRVEDIAPEAVKIGMRVKFRLHRPGDVEPAYPVFVPMEAG